MNDAVSLGVLWTEILADDPDWAAYVEGLSPKTPLRRAVADYVHALTSRLAPTPAERRAAEQVLHAMEHSGFDTIDEYFAVLEPGAVPADPRG